MTFRTSRQIDDVPAIARQIDGTLSAAIDRLQDLRAKIQTGVVDSGDAREAYQQLVAARNFTNLKISENPGPALAEAYVDMFKGNLQPDYNPGVEWAVTEAAIVAYAVWFQAAWPFKTPDNKPSFEAYGENGEITSFPLPLNNDWKIGWTTEVDKVLITIN